MEYTKENLKKEGEGIVDIFPEISQDLIKFASAWAQEVAELRELFRTLNKLLEKPSGVSQKEYTRFFELWAKHMEGGEG